jgi:hypothetical protein
MPESLDNNLGPHKHKALQRFEDDDRPIAIEKQPKQAAASSTMNVKARPLPQIVKTAPPISLAHPNPHLGKWLLHFHHAGHPCIFKI